MKKKKKKKKRKKRRGTRKRRITGCVDKLLFERIKCNCCVVLPLLPSQETPNLEGQHVADLRLVRQKWLGGNLRTEAGRMSVCQGVC